MQWLASNWGANNEQWWQVFETDGFRSCKWVSTIQTPNAIKLEERTMEAIEEQTVVAIQEWIVETIEERTVVAIEKKIVAAIEDQAVVATEGKIVAATERSMVAMEEWTQWEQTMESTVEERTVPTWCGDRSCIMDLGIWRQINISIYGAHLYNKNNLMLPVMVHVYVMLNIYSAHLYN